MGWLILLVGVYAAGLFVARYFTEGGLGFRLLIWAAAPVTVPITAAYILGGLLWYEFLPWLLIPRDQQ